MLESRNSRLLAAGLLVVVLVGLCVWYGSLPPAPEYGDYPDERHLAADYEPYVGERAVVSGAIVGTDPVVIEATVPADDPIRLTVENVPEADADGTPVEEGNVLRVYGTVESDATVRAHDVLVTPPIRFRYMYGVSVAAALWVFVRFVRRWRFDRRSFGFARRTEPLTIGWSDERRASIDGGRDDG